MDDLDEIKELLGATSVGTCADCIFYSNHGYSIGFCHRHSPTINENGKGVWPSVMETGWCGEFRARKGERHD